MVRVLPASAPPSARRATPSATTTRRVPRSRLPSPAPASSMASVMSATRWAPLAPMAMRAVSSWTWWPSRISSAVTRSSASTAPTVPGSRWWNAPMQLKRWVATVAPASNAAAAVSCTARVWPTATTTPHSTRRSTAARPPSSSGATVIIRTVPRPASMSWSTESRSGRRIHFGSWAPQASALRNGPSRWMPAIDPGLPSGRRSTSTSSASRPTAPMSMSTGAVTRLSRLVVVPWRRWKAMASAVSAGSPVITVLPPPPWTWRSTKPGTNQLPPRSVAPVPAGGSPATTSTISPWSMTTWPGSSTPAGVTTRAPARVLTAPSAVARP